jgi:hypothetical protein
LRLAAVQTSAGKGNDSLATIEALRKLSPPEGNDPRWTWLKPMLQFHFRLQAASRGR